MFSLKMKKLILIVFPKSIFFSSKNKEAKRNSFKNDFCDNKQIEISFIILKKV
jgi:hypothetical protein